MGVASAAALRAASPAGRRQLLRQTWDAPLRRAKLRRLRETIAAYEGCLDDLSARGRRTLILRAGLGDGKPASRRTIARRLDIPLKRELRVESGALRQLTSAGRAGRCGGAAYGAAMSGGGGALAGGTTSQSGQWMAATPSDERHGELAASERGGDPGGGGSKLDFVDRSTGAPNALLLLALAILGPLGVALLATRSRGAAKPPRT